MLKEINTVEDLGFLKDNKVSEDIDLDYKSKLPDLSQDESRLEFLRDICSFANTQGGQIIYGIEEVRGQATPEMISGVSLSKPDNEIRRIQDIIGSGLEEVVSGIVIKEILLSDDKYCIVVKIPKSFNCPHRVKASLDKDHRFYGRASKKRQELSFYEIRDKFMQSATMKEQIRKFRDDRINSILQYDTPANLDAGPRIILHIIPLSAFTSNAEIDLLRIKKMYQNPQLYDYFSPLGYRDGTKSEITLDGFLIYSSASKGGYVHFYREGIVEAVSMLPRDEENAVIYSRSYERSVLNQKYFTILKNLNIWPPFCIFLSLIGVNGQKLAIDSPTFKGANNHSRRSYNKEMILLRDVLLESYDESLDQVLKSSFDRFCNAWGFDCCPHYKDGSYNFNQY